MKKTMSMKKALAIFTPCITVVVAIMLALIIAASVFWQDISLWLYGRAQTADAAVLADGDALCEDIVEEGIVLLKNNESALPLTVKEAEAVNVFGWAAYDWMTMAFGSGYTNTDQEKLKLFPALEEAGIEYNKRLYDLYSEYYTAHNRVYGPQDDYEYRGGVAFGSEAIFTLHEPGYDKYTDEIKESIRSTSDVALVVIGRTGSESKDLKLEQTKQNQGNTSNTTTTDRHYLQLSTEEEEMIRVAKETCSKVIVILNTANTMETGFIDDDGIDAALLVGITGLKGVRGLINVLKGEKEEARVARDANGNPQYNDDGTPVYATDADGEVIYDTVKVSPSGRTADTYAYDILGTNPAAANYGAESRDGGVNTYSNATGEGSQYKAYIDYSEGIYVGYKWYETAYAEGYWKDVNNEYGDGYDGVVQYPFGYGLSYTTFDWAITSVDVSGSEKYSGALKATDKITITVEVTNTGNYPGMDVVELYYTPEYHKGGIEKAHVNLADFAKTGVIEPGATDIVQLEVSVQSMASYDCYDLNKNNHTGYELDKGYLKLSLMTDAHTEKEVSGKTFNGANAVYANAVLTYDISETINYDTDEKTGGTVENRFTNKDGNGNDQAIDNGDLDGSRESTPVKYMTREDFEGTYPQKQTTARTRTDEAATVAKNKIPSASQLQATGDDGATARSVGSSDSNLFQNLIDTAPTDYDDPIFEEVISHITNGELQTLISDGYFKTAKIDSIGKKEFVDLDGPLGFNTRVTGGGNTTCSFMSYPSGTMLAQTWNTDQAYAMGMSVGREAPSMDGLKGWYAPGANIHRNPFGGRNGEYYSEDGVLSGKICAGTVSGAKDMGVYSYVKHFVVNDSEKNREGLFTFLTEQTLREIYLKPFEIMIKEGGGNAIMTSMNRLGRVWSGANYGLMTQIVRNEWGFNGTAVTDWVNASDDYMPPYLGIWAGNDIWLSNGIGGLFNALNDTTAYKLGEKVAHDVLWTLVDTNNAYLNFDPTREPVDFSKGAVYNLTWVWYVVLVEVALAAGAGVMGFFLVKSILAERKPAGVKEAAESGEPNAEVPPVNEPDAVKPDETDPPKAE